MWYINEVVEDDVREIAKSQNLLRATREEVERHDHIRPEITYKKKSQIGSKTDNCVSILARASQSS